MLPSGMYIVQGADGYQLGGLGGRRPGGGVRLLKYFCSWGHILKAQQPCGIRLASMTGPEVAEAVACSLWQTRAHRT